MIGRMLDVSNGIGLVEAFDPATDGTIWVQRVTTQLTSGAANRGVAYLGQGRDRRVISFRNRYLYAPDP